MNDAFDMILRIEEDPVRGTKTAAQIRYYRIVKAQELIKKIEPHLWVYWAIGDDVDEPDVKEQTLKKRANLCEKFNYVLKLLHDMQMASSKYDASTDKGVITMGYFTNDEIKRAEFLSKIKELHRVTHGKVLRLGTLAKDAEGEMLVKLVNIAFYCAVHGNRFRVDIPEQYEQRKHLFSQAISALKRMERYLFNLFTIGSYSNNEMKEWAELLTESSRLLYAVHKSDTKRAG